jgi:hypothetical protein
VCGNDWWKVAAEWQVIRSAKTFLVVDVLKLEVCTSASRIIGV